MGSLTGVLGGLYGALSTALVVRYNGRSAKLIRRGVSMVATLQRGGPLTSCGRLIYEGGLVTRGYNFTIRLSVATRGGLLNLSP